MAVATQKGMALKFYVPGLGAQCYIASDELDPMAVPGSLYIADTGAANTITVAPNPSYTSLTAGMTLNVKIKTANTGATTIAVNGLTATPVTKQYNVALVTGDLLANQIATFVYDGTQFQLVSTPASINVAAAASYAVTAGAAGVQTATLSPVPASYTTGMEVLLKIGAGLTNTGATTINLNALGAKNILRAAGAALQPGDLLAGGVYDLIYDGTQFLLQMPSTPTDQAYWADTGAVNAAVVTPAPAWTAYNTGARLMVKIGAGNTNTGATTINVNALGVKNVLGPNAGTLPVGALLAGAIVEMVYDGTQFQVVTLPASPVDSGYYADTGAANALVITPSPAITTYTAGQSFSVKVGAGNTNTGACTIAVSGLLAKAIQQNGAALAANAVIAGQVVRIVYDGTQFELIGGASTVNTTGAVTTAGGITNTATTAANVNLGDGAITQLTSLITSVTLNSSSGVITTVSATTGALASQSFTLTNSAIGAASSVVVSIVNYGGTYFTNGTPYVTVSSIAGGSCQINVLNLHTVNALSGVLKIAFAVV